MSIEICDDIHYVRLREAVEAYKRRDAEWFATVNARPFDADRSARAALDRDDARDALYRLLEDLPSV